VIQARLRPQMFRTPLYPVLLLSQALRLGPQLRLQLGLRLTRLPLRAELRLALLPPAARWVRRDPPLWRRSPCC
jgi:hypothetical protein